MTCNVQSGPLAGVAAAVLLIVGIGAWYGLAPGLASEGTARRLASGRVIYDQQCAAYHGGNLEGQPNWQKRQSNGRLPASPHDTSGHTWHHPDDVLFGITKHGLGPYAPAGYQSDMPAFADKLTDEEIRAVLAHIKNTWPPDIQARQAAMTDQMEKRRR